MLRSIRVGAVALVVSCAISNPSFANEYTNKTPFIVTPVGKGQLLSFDVKSLPKGVHNVVVSVSGPRNFQAQLMEKERIPGIDLSKFGRLYDGQYKFLIAAATAEKIEINPSGLNNGRDRETPKMRVLSTSTSGIFWVEKGEIVIPKNMTEGKG